MIQPEDYYMDKGVFVFTEAYHLKRGRCCKSGCRHCPWKFKREITDYSNKRKLIANEKQTPI